MLFSNVAVRSELNTDLMSMHLSHNRLYAAHKCPTFVSIMYNSVIVH